MNNINEGISILAEHKSDDLSVFVIGESNYKKNKPANGGLRLLCYKSDEDCINDGVRLAHLMKCKHEIYSTGFSGGKVVARAKEPTLIKNKLITITAELLDSLNGNMITGCDLNTTITDMEKLQELTPYVLAAVGSELDASSATAYGVMGSIDSYVESVRPNKNKKFTALIHGCGSVGSVVAKLLIKSSWNVLTVDLDNKKADIEGAKVIDSNSKWWKEKFDVLIPCSISGLLTKEIINSININAIVSAANAPFLDPKDANYLQEKGVEVIPDPLVNAGAVIADSIELFAPDLWKSSPPKKIYEFVRQSIKESTSFFLDLRTRGFSTKEALKKISKDKSNYPIGLDFANFLK